jgi:hypothetical protein
MKNLLLLIALIAAVYTYNNQSAEVNIDSYETLLAKVKFEAVTLDEVKTGANLLNTSICNNIEFQSYGGRSVQSCTDKYLAFKSMCEDRIFGTEPRKWTKKQDIIVLVKRIQTCTGIS